MTLIHSTIRIALGFMAGNTAAILARGVLNSMLLDRLRVATVLLCLGIGGSYWAWHAFASAVDGKGQANPGPAVVRAVCRIPAAPDRSLRRSLAARGRDAPGHRPLPPGPVHQATSSIRRMVSSS